MESNTLHTALVEQTSREASLRWRFMVESKKQWRVTGPAILSKVFMFEVNIVTQALVGHMGDLELAALSMVIYVIWAFNYGISMGLVSALQTLCGQAFGAQKYGMLGMYLQRSCIVSFGFAALFLPLYVFASPILELFGQAHDIAQLTGKVAIWCIPMHFALVLRNNAQSFLQCQTKNMITAAITGVTLLVHVFLSWLFTVKFGWGFGGAVASMNIAWWMPGIASFIYIIFGGCPDTWTGFSKEVLSDLGSYLKLSVSSGIMICLELWYYRVLVLLAGNLKDAKIAIDSLSICMSIVAIEIMIPMGFMAGTSVRVSNELGAQNGKAARFVVVVSSTTSLVIGIVIMIFIFAFRDSFPSLYTDSTIIHRAVSKLANLLALTILFNSVQPVLSGAAVGSGKQGIVAYVNLITYYLIGVPLGVLLGYILHLSVMGVWIGMIGGTAIQTAVLLIIICRSNWLLEATVAVDRVKTWSSPSSVSEEPV